MLEYDLVVVGSGPAGEKAAVKAAYFGYKVAIVDKGEFLGGTGVNTGTIPSKALKETAIYYSGERDKGLYGVDKVLTHQADMNDYMYRKSLVVKNLRKEVKENLDIHGVDIYLGTASFKDKNKIHISGPIEEVIYGKFILLATGSSPYHPKEFLFDDKNIFDSDSILNIKTLPSSICILGAGVIGCEYATIFSKLGCEVILINKSDKVLPFLDTEVSKALLEYMKQCKIRVVLNNSVSRIEFTKDENKPLRIIFETKQEILVDSFLYAAGRKGNINSLKLDVAKVKYSGRGNIIVDSNYQTSVENIYAVGDVVGFPALASTSMDQGRVAVQHMFQTKDTIKVHEILPFGIYTIPEVSMVGLTEQEATEKGISYCTGSAEYKDIPRGMIVGSIFGFLKIIFRRQDRVVIGIHIIGDQATEYIHYGMYIVEHSLNLHEIINKVFNYPTFHDLYKYAAYDGLGNLSGHKVKGGMLNQK